MFGAESLISTAGFAHELIASSQNDDAKEGNDEAESGVDMPLTEDDAEIGSVPGEQHL